MTTAKTLFAPAAALLTWTAIAVAFLAELRLVG